MEWFIVIAILFIAFIPTVYRINKRIYKIEQAVSNNCSCSKQ